MELYHIFILERTESSMKKLSLLATIVVIPLLLIGAVKLPLPTPGEYSGKFVNISKDDFFKEDNLRQHANAAVLTDTKPDEITIDSALKLDKPKYGSVLFGDNDKRIYFVMTQDKDGYWTDFYIDQNLDSKITSLEKIKNNGKWNPQKTNDGWDLMETSVETDPFQITISYKGSTGEINKKLSMYLWTYDYTKKGSPETVYVSLQTVSAFEGFMKVLIGKDEKLVKYRVIDANSTGCFNNYGKNYLYLDLNFDGYFSKKEALPLYEFFDQKVDKTTTQMRFIIPACPAKIAIAPAVDNTDIVPLEASSDDVAVSK
jgi:hypothetical protein